MIKLLHGDCLELMKEIPSNSIDMVLCDPPYGNTYCKWDVVIDLDQMWKQLKRIVREDGAICIFGKEPFSSLLRASNIRMFKYDWIWHKDRCGNFGAAKFQPLNYYEIISVFYKKCRYFPIMTKNTGRIRDRRRDKSIGKNKNPTGETMSQSMNYGYSADYDPTKLYPRNMLKFNRDLGYHVCQKPVNLLEYLIKTYTLDGETVLDFTMGSGSAGVASQNLGRKFIGIEKDAEYFKVAVDRIAGCNNSQWSVK